MNPSHVTLGPGSRGRSSQSGETKLCGENPTSGAGCNAPRRDAGRGHGAALSVAEAFSKCTGLAPLSLCVLA